MTKLNQVKQQLKTYHFDGWQFHSNGVDSLPQTIYS